MANKDLVVVAFEFPYAERNTEKIEPDLELLKKFPDHHFYFCTSSLTIKEVASFFRKKYYGYERGGEYEYRLSARKSYLRALKKGIKPEHFFCLLDYSENVREVLTLENKLKKNGIKQSEANKIKEKILYLQTFQRAKLVLDQIVDLKGKNLVYAELSLAYSIHLLTGCRILFDLPQESKEKPIELGKMREGLTFFYKAHAGIVNLEKSEDLGQTVWTGGQQQKIIHDKKGVKYLSDRKSFYLMNGRPQNGFCPFHQSEYKVLTN